MQHAAHVIQALERTNSRLEKEAIIQQAWDLNILEFFVGARLALDALNTFGVQKVPQVSDPNQTGTYSWAHFASLTSALSARTLTGHAARDAIQQAADSCDQITWNFWYRRLLLKDLKCGTSETTINKVLLRNGGKALSYQVPVFSCQLAKNADDHAKKMKGIKLCDFKLDGFRCLTVLYPSGKVEQFTRNGLSNTNFGHICEQLKPVAQSLDQPWVFDGEMISENFQTLMTQVNRKDNVNTSDSTLVLFDCVPLAEFQKGAWNVSQRDRLKQLHEWAPMLTHVSLGVVKVAEQVEVNLDTPEGQDRLTQFNQQALALKLEGIMIKDPDAPYECKRSDAWLKRKPWESYDLQVTQVEPGKPGTKYEHTMGAVWFEGSDQGKQISVSVGSGWSDSDRDEIWAIRDQIVNSWVAEIKTDVLTLSQNSDVYSMRFPVFMRWRDQGSGKI